MSSLDGFAPFWMVRGIGQRRGAHNRYGRETTMDGTTSITARTAGIVAAYVARNPVPAGEVPALIATVHGALSGLGRVPEPVAAKASPAEVRRSITPDHLISFVDGKRYRSLKRHLRGHDLTPDAYRTRFGLPSDYPMVAASYRAARSELAKTLGLGRKAAA